MRMSRSMPHSSTPTSKRVRTKARSCLGSANLAVDLEACDSSSLGPQETIACAIEACKLGQASRATNYLSTLPSLDRWQATQPCLDYGVSINQKRDVPVALLAAQMATQAQRRRTKSVKRLPCNPPSLVADDACSQTPKPSTTKGYGRHRACGGHRAALHWTGGRSHIRHCERIAYLLDSRSQHWESARTKACPLHIRGGQRL